MSILFKTLALVLCLTFLFAVMIPQAQAGWGFWKCISEAAACAAAWVAAGTACAGGGPVACAIMTSIALGICATVDANC